MLEPTVGQLVTKFAHPWSSFSKKSPQRRSSHGIVGRRGKDSPLEFVFSFSPTTFTLRGPRVCPCKGQGGMAAKQAAKFFEKQFCVGAKGRSKMVNYLSCYKSLRCADTTEHFHSVRFLFSTEMLGQRTLLASDECRESPDWVSVTMETWDFFGEQSGDVCSLQAGERPPACMSVEAGGCKWPTQWKTLVHLHVSTPLPDPPQIKMTEEQCNRAADSRLLLLALAENHKHWSFVEF